MKKRIVYRPAETESGVQMTFRRENRPAAAEPSMETGEPAAMAVKLPFHTGSITYTGTKNKRTLLLRKRKKTVEK